MPFNILAGLLAVVVALVLYSVGAWSAFRAKCFTRRSLTVLWIGVVFDALATFLMGLSIGGLDLRPGLPMVHTTLALLAMAGMMLGTAVATWAVMKKRGALEATMSRVLLAPWALWAGVFVFGMLAQRRG